MKKQIFLLVCLLVLIVLFSASCGKTPDEPPEDKEITITIIIVDRRSPQIWRNRFLKKLRPVKKDRIEYPALKGISKPVSLYIEQFSITLCF